MATLWLPLPMDKNNAPLLVYPSPTGLNTPTVESLSGYVQRLAAANGLSISSTIAMIAADAHLPLFQRVNSRFLRTIDLQLAFLPSPLFAIGAPWELLGQLSLVAVFKTFYGTLDSYPTSVYSFFASPYEKRSIQIDRRWCPPCLLQQANYQSLWQFSEVRTCLIHGCNLRDRCASCRHPVSVLHVNSFFDRCEHCYAQLSKQPPSPALQRLLESQKNLQTDYGLLLSGQLARFDSSSYSSWRRSLIYLREQKGLTRKDLAKALHISPSTITLLESDSEVVSLQVITRATRCLTDSLVKLSRTAVPVGWSPTPTRKWRPSNRQNLFPLSTEDEAVLHRISAGLQKLEAKECAITISGLSAAAGVKQRTVEQFLAIKPALRHQLIASKEAAIQSIIRQRVRIVLSKKRRGDVTIESVCRAVGTTKARLREIDEQLYCTLKAELQNVRAVVAAKREKLLIDRLKTVMTKRVLRGLPCSRRAISSQLQCEFKNHPRVYATWKELRRL